MSDGVQSRPAAGWYDDPVREGGLRWWDGIAWTEYYRDRPVVVPEPVPAPLETVASASSDPVSRLSAYDPADPYKSYRVEPARVEPAFTATPRRQAVFGGTRVVWYLAAYPLISTTIQSISFSMTWNGTGFSSLGISIGVFIPLILLALRDRSELEQRGLDAPSWAWLLLFPPLGYLVVRAVQLSREGVDAKWPPIAYCVAWIVSVGVAFVVVIQPELASFNREVIATMERDAAAQLGATTNTAWTVDCTDDAHLEIPGTRFSCVASDTAGTIVTVWVRVRAPFQLEADPLQGN